MSYEQPTPPPELPTDIVETLEDYPPELLHHVSRYAEEFAEYREREARLSEIEDADGDRVEDQPEDLPDDVPSKATITIKEINDNRYYYWQWRDGDKIKSEYKGPVESEG